MTSKPEPLPSPLTEPYWRAANEGVLAIQRCGACRTWIHLPERQCPKCGSVELRYEPVSGRGTVSTFSVVYRSFVEGFGTEPYVIAWIDLAEQPGLRTFANVTGCAPHEVRVGLPVEVWFEARGGRLIPNFKAAEIGQ